MIVIMLVNGFQGLFHLMVAAMFRIDKNSDMIKCG